MQSGGKKYIIMKFDKADAQEIAKSMKKENDYGEGTPFDIIQKELERFARMSDKVIEVQNG